MKRFLLFIAAAVATISCNNDALTEATPTPEEGAHKVTVNLSMSDDAMTRVDLTDDGNGGYKTDWSFDDAVGAWSADRYKNYTFNKFTMADYDADNMSIAQFTGSISYAQAEDVIRFVYPYLTTQLTNIDQDSDNFYEAFAIDLTEQSPAADLTAVSSTFMVSEPITYSEVESTTPEMKHIGAALDVKMKLEGADSYTLEDFTISGLASKGNYNLRAEADALTDVESADIYVMPIVDADANGVFSTTINILPCTFAAGDEITIIANFTKADSEPLCGTYTYTMTAAGSYDRATRCQFGAILEKTAVKGSKENPYTYAEAKAVYKEGETIADVWVKGTIIGAFNNSLNAFVTSGVSSNFALGDDKYNCIPVALKSGSDARKYININDNPGNLGKVIMVKGELSAYFSTAGLKNLSDYEFVNDGTVKPIFTGLNPESLTFESGVTSAESVTIEGNNLEAATINVTIDDDTNFAVNYESGVTFTVAPKAENTTSAEFTAIVTVDVDGETKTLALLQAPAGGVAAEKGSKENPYTYAEALQNKGKSNVWVKGVIVGNASGKSALNSSDNYNDYNIAIGGDTKNFVIAKLANDFRTDLGLASNPDYLNKTILVCGNLVKGYSTTVLDPISEYEFVDGDGGTVTPDAASITLEGGNGISASASDGTFVESEATFEYSDLYYSSYGSYTIGAGEGYLCNLTEMIGLSEIVVTEDYQHYNISVYVGASVDACNTKVNSTKVGDDYKYSISAGNKFFKIVNESTYTASADKIAFKYESLGTTVESTLGGGTVTPDPGTNPDAGDATDIEILSSKISGGYGDGNLKVDNCDFEYTNVANYGSGIQMNTSKISSSLWNTTALAGLSKVEITISKECKGFKVFTGSSVDSINNEVDCDVKNLTDKVANGTVLTYVITSGEYVKIAPNDGAAYASSIKIYATK